MKKINRILFVIPSYSDKVIDDYTTSVVLPYGVLSLASYLELHCKCISIRVLDFNIVNSKQNAYKILKKEIISFNPDISGISVMYNPCKKYVAPFADVIKAIKKETLLIVGGILATNMTKEVLMESNLIDAVCFGEGELPLRDLVNSKDILKTLNEHPSFILPGALEHGKTPKQSFVYDLDDIPMLNYSLVDITKYKSRISSKDGKEKITLPIHSTRGCPYSCIFCCSATNHGRRIRYMSTHRFLSDVKKMKEKYKITKLSIDDDQFMFNRERVIEILTGLADLNLELEMANGLTVKYITKKSRFKNCGNSN